MLAIPIKLLGLVNYSVGIKSFSSGLQREFIEMDRSILIGYGLAEIEHIREQKSRSQSMPNYEEISVIIIFFKFKSENTADE